MGCIYQVTNRMNGKSYIGKTQRSLRRRKESHEEQAKNQALYPFHRAIRKYGAESFDWVELYSVKQLDILNFLEKVCIKFRHTKKPNGYNLTDGGEGVVGYKFSKEANIRNSVRKLGVKRKPFTKETKQRMSIAAQNRIKTEAGKLQMEQAALVSSKIRKGKKQSLERRLAQSLRVKESWKNPEYRAKHITAMRRRTVRLVA